MKGSLIKLKSYSRQIPVPFKIYADFEFIIKKVILLMIIVDDIVDDNSS